MVCVARTTLQPLLGRTDTAALALLLKHEFLDGGRHAGVAVDLLGLRHVVDADDEGQAACEECVSQLRVKDQVVAPSRTVVVHAAAGENVKRVSVDALARQAGQSA